MARRSKASQSGCLSSLVALGMCYIAVLFLREYGRTILIVAIIICVLLMMIAIINVLLNDSKKTHTKARRRSTSNKTASQTRQYREIERMALAQEKEYERLTREKMAQVRLAAFYEAPEAANTKNNSFVKEELLRVDRMNG